MSRVSSAMSKSDHVNQRLHALIPITLLLAATASQAALHSVEEAFEVAPVDVTLPVSESGQLVVRPCASCTPQMLRVDATTRYLLPPGATQVSLAEFTRSTAQAAGHRTAAVAIFYDPQTRSARRLVLHPGR